MKSIDNLETLSDGKRYTVHDLVRVDTGGCQVCSACCHGTTELVVLNPMDVFQISQLMQLSFDGLLKNHLTLKEQSSGLRLPHLKSIGDSEQCSFLNHENRCSIHGARPDICRLFPLGRVYDGDDFQYFLQKEACVKSSLTKVKIKKWLGLPRYTEYHAFILDWYKIQKALAFRLKFIKEEDERLYVIHFLLDTFYRMTIEGEGDFYSEFYNRLPHAKQVLGII